MNNDTTHDGLSPEEILSLYEQAVKDVKFAFKDVVLAEETNTHDKL